MSEVEAHNSTSTATNIEESVKEVTMEEATAEFSGCLVKIDCGDEGIYSGIVSEVDPTNLCIKIENPHRNGVSLGDHQAAQIPGQLIKGIQILNMPSSPRKARSELKSPEQSHSLSDNPLSKKLSSNALQKPRLLNRYQPLANQQIPSPPQKLLTKNRKILAITTDNAKKSASTAPTAPHKQKTPNKTTSQTNIIRKQPLVLRNEGKTRVVFNSSSRSSKPPQPVSILRRDTTSLSSASSATVDKNSRPPSATFRSDAPPFIPKKKILSITPPLPTGNEEIPSTTESDSAPVEPKKVSNEKEEIEKSNDKESKMGEKEQVVKKNAKKKETADDGENKAMKKAVTKNTTGTRDEEQQKKRGNKDERNKREKEKRGMVAEEKMKKKKGLEAKEVVEQLEQGMSKLGCSDGASEETESVLEEKMDEAQAVPTTETTTVVSTSTGEGPKQFVGELATIECGPKAYQGKIAAVDPQEQCIRLEKPFLDGRPLNQKSIVLFQRDISNIRIYPSSPPSEKPEQCQVLEKPQPYPRRKSFPSSSSSASNESSDTTSSVSSNRCYSLSSTDPELAKSAAFVAHVSGEQSTPSPTYHRNDPSARSVTASASESVSGRRRVTCAQRLKQRATPVAASSDEYRSATETPTYMAHRIKPKFDLSQLTPVTTETKPTVCSQSAQSSRSCATNRKENQSGNAFPIAQIPVSVLSSSKVAAQLFSPQKPSVKDAPPKQRSPAGQHINVNELLKMHAVAAPSSSTSRAKGDGQQHRSLGGSPLAYESFGEFRLFREPQHATPVRLRVNQSRGNNHEIGPTGIPLVDCSNGYSGYAGRKSAEMLDEPLDFHTLNQDFDFDGNLALFDKTEFNRATEQFFEGLDSAGDHARNYRHNENVLQDSSRVISWTKEGPGSRQNTASPQSG